MHMADALLSPAVAGTMYACSTAVAAYSVTKIRKEDDQTKIPTMGIMGAFVFAAQMINLQYREQVLQDICAEECCCPQCLGHRQVS